MKAHIVYTKFRDESLLLFDRRLPADDITEHFIPAGFEIYGIRHADSELDKPVTVENSVIVNRWGGAMRHQDTNLFNGPAIYTELTEEESVLFTETMNNEPSEPMVLISLSHLTELIKRKK